MAKCHSRHCLPGEVGLCRIGPVVRFGPITVGSPAVGREPLNGRRLRPIISAMTESVAVSAPRRILLGVTGGIAAYKAAELVRRLRTAGPRCRS